jgi:gluconate kinase
MQTLLLLGGISGAGKSTLALGIKAKYGEDCFNFDFGSVYSRDSTHADKELRWQDQILESIRHGFERGHNLVIANSMFLRRERRDLVFDTFPEQRKLAIMLTPPILTAFHRVKDSRPEGSHTTNAKTAYSEMVRACGFAVENDHSDVLLPSDKSMLPKEYLAMFNRTELNRHMLSQNGCDPNVRWVATAKQPDPYTYVELVRSGITEPYDVRDFIERTSTMVERPLSRA